MDRVPGVPLYTVDINCHCYDPNKTFVLHSNAWMSPPAGQFGTAAVYHDDDRYQRRPTGFGPILANSTTTFSPPRRGTLVVRFEF
jgi:hypothetical protein